jgi:hypothetical protein
VEVGEHEQKFLARRASALQRCFAAIVIVVAACLFDYFVNDRPHALWTLVAVVTLIAGFALWQDRSGHTAAIKRDRENELHEAELETRHDERLRKRGLR